MNLVIASELGWPPRLDLFAVVAAQGFDAAHLGALATARRGVHWNNDVVTEVPPGALVLARTPQGDVEVVRHGPAAWGVQLHPEVDASVVARWAASDDKPAPGVDTAAEVARIDAARPELDEAWAPLALSFARLVGERALR